jgi:hypothetical protein
MPTNSSVTSTRTPRHESQAVTGVTALSTQPQRARGRHAIACLWFWAWAVIGALGTLGLVSFALGPLALGPALIAGAVLATNRAARRSTFGLLLLVGAIVLQQRQGD